MAFKPLFRAGDILGAFAILRIRSDEPSRYLLLPRTGALTGVSPISTESAPF